MSSCMVGFENVGSVGINSHECHSKVTSSSNPLYSRRVLFCFNLHSTHRWPSPRRVSTRIARSVVQHTSVRRQSIRLRRLSYRTKRCWTGRITNPSSRTSIYTKLAKQNTDFAVALLGLCRSAEEVSAWSGVGRL